jgi:hypothetical protein
MLILVKLPYSVCLIEMLTLFIEMVVLIELQRLVIVTHGVVAILFNGNVDLVEMPC